MNRLSRLIAATVGIVLAAGILSAASTSGTPGGVARVQGISGGVPVPVSGTVTVTSTSVQGMAAHDAPIAGSPVRIGTRATNASIASVSNGDVTDSYASLTGVPLMTTNAAAADGNSNNNLGTFFGNNAGANFLGTYPFVFNGTTWDRLPGSTNGQTVVTVNTTAVADGASNNNVNYWRRTDGSNAIAPTAGYVYNGSTWDRWRSAGGVGSDAPGSGGLPASAGYGQYLTNASQTAGTNGHYIVFQTDPAGNLRTAPQRPTAGDILGASATVTSTTGSTALITVSAGRTWVGTLCASVAGSKAAAATGNGEVLGSFLTAGTNVTPAAGTYFEVDTAIGANAATGVTGTQGSGSECTPFTVVAPAGNTVTVNYAATCTSTTACRASFSANGVMQ